MTPPCEHFEPDLQVDPPLSVCPACVESGGTWVHLRQCLACGQMGCCDMSPNRHATAHFRAAGHPMIRAVDPDETWQWCFVDLRLYFPDSPLTGIR